MYIQSGNHFKMVNIPARSLERFRFLTSLLCLCAVVAVAVVFRTEEIGKSEVTSAQTAALHPQSGVCFYLKH